MTLLLAVLALGLIFGFVLSNLFSIQGALKGARSWVAFWCDELGAASVTYDYPTFSGNPSTVAPTAVQSSQVNAVTGTLVFADADTTATVTHNFGFSVSSLARGNPFWECQQLGGGTPSPLLAFQFTSNTVVITKQSTAAGSGGSLEFKAWRNSLILPLIP